MEILEWNFIHLYKTYLPSGKNRTCGPAIPVQRSNQLRYKETVVELYPCTSSWINNVMPMYGVWINIRIYYILI